MHPISVVIADSDHARRVECERLLRQDPDVRLAGEPDIFVVGHAKEPSEMLAALACHRPETVILGAEENSPRVLELVSVIRSGWPTTRTLLLSSHDTAADWMIQAVLCGARGLLTSDSLSRQLLKALRVIRGNQLWISRRLAGRLLDRALH